MCVKGKEGYVCGVDGYAGSINVYRTMDRRYMGNGWVGNYAYP